MKQNGANVLVVFGLACLNLIEASQVLQERIEPDLEPKSDKKFFGKDYPDDVRPAVIHHFSHPYPTVQDSDRYDKDYVKDENDDGGYWKAQMEYDRLKNKLAKEKKEMAQAPEEAAEKKAEAAEKKEEAAENERQDADAKHDKIQDYLDEAAEKKEEAAENERQDADA